MNSIARNVLTGFCCAAALAAASVALSDPGQKPEPARIGVVDYWGVVKKWKQGQEDLERQTKAEQEADKKQQEFEKQLKSLDQEIALANPGPAKEAKTRDRDQLASKATAEMQFLLTQLNDSRLKLYRGQYEKVGQRIEDLARQQGVDIVLRRHPFPEPDGDNPMRKLKDFQDKMLVRQVLFSRSEIDLTDKVAEALNAGAAAGAAKGPAPRPTRVAVLDVERAREASKLWKEGLVDLKTRELNYRAQLDRIGADFDAKRKQIDELKKAGKEPDAKLLNEAEAVRLDGESRQRTAQQEIDDEQCKLVVRCYKAVCDAADAYAQANGFDLVIRSYEMQELKGKTLYDRTRDFEIQAATRGVLSARPDLDITNAVIEALNRK